VKKSKTYFEQIPVEVVKKIAKELPHKREREDEEQMENGKVNFRTSNANTELASCTGGFARRKGV